jgi:hypothetical protein
MGQSLRSRGRFGRWSVRCLWARRLVPLSSAVLTGLGADGVIAQSVGGGGGVVGGEEFATVLPTIGSFTGSAGGSGSAGLVTVNVRANVLAAGANATGIVAASTDSSGLGGDITITVGSGGAPGQGDEPANAVRLIGGASNLLTNSGFLTTGAGVGGFTVAGGLGADSIRPISPGISSKPRPASMGSTSIWSLRTTSSMSPVRRPCPAMSLSTSSIR